MKLDPVTSKHDIRLGDDDALVRGRAMSEKEL
jgi:hypothetical protein